MRSFLIAVIACVLAPAAVFGQQDNRALSDAVRKLNGAVDTDNRYPARPMPRVIFDNPKDSDIEALRTHFEKSPGPIHLWLNYSDAITDAALAHLKGLKSIVRLTVPGAKITDAGFAHVATLPNLEELRVTNNDLTNAALAHLAKSTSLRRLIVRSKGITDEGFAHVAGLTELELLFLGPFEARPGDKSLAFMKGLTKLRFLDIGSEDLTDAGMVHLKNFAELRELRLGEGPALTAAGLAHLAALKKLEKLTIVECKAIGGDGAAFLKELTELQELALHYGSKIDANAAGHLGKLTKLKRLHLRHFDNSALKGIKDLTSLEEIHFTYATLDDAGMEHLAGLTGLQVLDLQSTQITDAGLKHLSKLPNLRQLQLNGTNVGSAGVQQLGGLPKLEVLYLDRTRVKDDGIAHLKGVPNLSWLTLSSTAVTDACIPHLKAMRSLEYIDLQETKVSLDEAWELKRALPRARVRDAFGHEPNADKRPEDEPPPKSAHDATGMPTALRMDAREFFKEFKKDQEAIEKKYARKAIELTGVVRKVNRPGGGLIGLDVGDDSKGIQCYTVEPSPWQKATPGVKVTIKGVMTAESPFPLLVGCVIVEAGPAQAITISAEQFTRECAADIDAAAKKFNKKHLIVSGEIVDRTIMNGFVTFVLKGAGDARIRCTIEWHGRYNEIRRWKIGQQVRLVGAFDTVGNPNDLRMDDCLPLPDAK